MIRATKTGLRCIIDASPLMLSGRQHRQGVVDAVTSNFRQLSSRLGW